MPPRTAIQARRSLGANPVPSRSGGSYGGGEDFGSPFKDEDNKYTPPGSSDEGNVDYGGGDSGGDQGDDNKGGPSTVIPKTEDPPKKKFTIQDTFDFFAKFSPTLAIGKGFGAGIEKLFGSKPKANQFTNPNDLAIIQSLFTDEKGRVDVDKLDEYYNQYKVTIGEGLTSDQASGEAAKFFEEQGIVDPTRVKEEFQNAILGATIPQGSEAQRRLDPEAYYNKDLFLKEGGEQAEMLKDYPEFLANMGLKPMSSRFANTTGNLVDKANIDVNTPGLSREFKEEIFNARMELDRMGRDRSGNPQGNTNQGGGGGTYVPPTTTPDDPIIPQDPTLPPGVTPPTTTPKYPGSVVTDYTQLGLPNIYGNQQMPNYAMFNRAGSMPVGLQEYLDSLRKRFGIG
jgi:hypothetical protein